MVRFSFDQEQNGRDDTTGSFEVLVEAGNADEAVEACKPYLTKMVAKEKRDAFGGKLVMYLDDLFEVSAPLSKPALINFRVHPADGFSEIINPMLDAPDQVNAYRWGDPETKDKSEPFMSFEPTPTRVRLEASKKSKPVGKASASKRRNDRRVGAGSPQPRKDAALATVTAHQRYRRDWFRSRAERSDLHEVIEEVEVDLAERRFWSLI